MFITVPEARVMDIFSLLHFVGGLAMFLFGMTVMGENLRRMTGGKPQGWLGRLCKTPLRGVALGALVTALIQSSSATTVMVVGFVNSGIMTLSQSVGVIMGANLGTTFTSWLLSLTELGGGVLEFLNPSSFAPLLGVIGIVFVMNSKTDLRRDLGYAFLGFTVLITGMNIMSSTVKPLADMPGFAEALTMFRNPLLGIAAGALLTAVIQSSSASVGILQALAASGALTRGAALPIILGQNIGTCVTTLLSGLGAGKNARRAAFLHLYFNVIGTAAALTAVYGIRLFGGLESYWNSSADAASIALIHTVFNVFSTVILLPFSRQLEKLALLTVRDGEEKRKKKAKPGKERTEIRNPYRMRNLEEYSILDERFLSSPAFAFTMAREAFFRMYELARRNFGEAMAQIGGFDSERQKKIEESELLIDAYEDSIKSYLIKLSEGRMGSRMSDHIYSMYGAVGDIERIGDHAIDISDIAVKISDDGRRLDAGTAAELDVCRRAVEELLLVAAPSPGEAEEKARRVDRTEPLEEAVDRLTDEVGKRCVARMVESRDARGSVYIDELLIALERIADHGANIAGAAEGSGTAAHSGLRDVRAGETFEERVREYLDKYALPDAGGDF